MSEPSDDTPERGDAERRERPRGSYYYDDAMGYEVYTPEEGEEETADDESNTGMPP